MMAGLAGLSLLAVCAIVWSVIAMTGGGGEEPVTVASGTSTTERSSNSSMDERATKASGTTSAPSTTMRPLGVGSPLTSSTPPPPSTTSGPAPKTPDVQVLPGSPNPGPGVSVLPRSDATLDAVASVPAAAPQVRTETVGEVPAATSAPTQTPGVTLTDIPSTTAPDDPTSTRTPGVTITDVTSTSAPTTTAGGDPTCGGVERKSVTSGDVVIIVSRYSAACAAGSGLPSTTGNADLADAATKILAGGHGSDAAAADLAARLRPLAEFGGMVAVTSGDQYVLIQIEGR
ncbi:hypothetical protein [Rhodococcus sp. BH5]|uniref:hypothetical protein n=1 Tax=Rhodococcus sp. BH5 TaxID=2871702 RepID=UPI0022CD6191|nr:hypothetical protein [Rhodococcus sp. BH5]MCZ9635046.1 hypothetical protein [Rhodococcus sp. BH5]